METTNLSKEATLAQILKARDDRVIRQQTLLSVYHCPLISFTMNIAGPVKVSPLIERAFSEGLKALEKCLSQTHILFFDTHVSVTGCEAIYVVDMDATALKKICTDLEDGTSLGRLFDMDVLDGEGERISRDVVNGKSRDCIVCGAKGRVCSAGRLHSVARLQEATRNIISSYFARTDREKIASLAVQSLIDEVYTTPKPGLVDQRNNGSHKDMTLQTFVDSAHSLEPYFQECIEIGQNTTKLSPSETFPLLRQAGIRAEAVMYQTTNGVNTHKGIIYTMGILCGSIGRLWSPERPLPQVDAILKEAGRIAEASVASDFLAIAQTQTAQTAGEQLYQSRGLTGIRGEVAKGLPSVAQMALPAFQQALLAGCSDNDAGVATLLRLIACVQDTNLYHRGGSSGASFAALSAQKLLAKNPYPCIEDVEELDDAFIARNLSPGGCADLLAVTYFLYCFF